MSILFFNYVFVYAAFTTNSESGFNINYVGVDEIPYNAGSINAKLKNTANLNSITFDYDDGVTYEEIKATGKPYVDFTDYTGTTPISSYVVATETITDVYFLCEDDIISPTDCSSMFGELTTVTSVNLTNFNTTNCITDHLFQNCSALSEITIGIGITNIGWYAFEECSQLTKVITPDVNSWATIAFSHTYSNPLYYAHQLYSTTDTTTPLTQITINEASIINSYAFEYCTSLTSVTIGSSVASIGSRAFKHCSGLTSITIPNSVTSISPEAFNSCRNITSVSIGKGVTNIGTQAFSGCHSLTSIEVNKNNTKYHSSGNCIIETASKTLVLGCKESEIPIDGSVTIIASYAFYDCYIDSITIPNHVTSIGNYVFTWCTSLTSIVIPESVISIGYYSFHQCSNLESVTFENPNNWYLASSASATSGTDLSSTDLANTSTAATYLKSTHVEKIWKVKVVDLSMLTFTLSNDGTYYSITDCDESATGILIIPETYNDKPVTNIGDDVFYKCRGLTSVKIPDGVTSIGNDAFYLCEALTSITIPDSVTSIGNDAFCYCEALTSITIPDSVTSIGSSAFGTCNSLTRIEVDEGNTKYHSAGNCLIETASKTLIAGCKTSVIPTDESVTSIGNDAFYGCSGLTSIIIPDSVTRTGENAFYGCENLTSITIPNSVTSIGDAAFYGCSGLTSITIPNSVTSIGGNAFRKCSGLTNIEIPNSVTSIGLCAFTYCSLTSISVDKNNTTYYSEGNCIITKADNTLILGCKNSTIPNSVTSIGVSAFYGCSGLTSITIPDSVTIIGNNAFCGCIQLTSITIPNSVTIIGKNAFESCRGLTEIVIPNSVTSIGYCAFYKCDSLTSVTFENTNDWFVASDENATSGTNLRSIDLANPSTAVTYLTSTYYNKHWKRS